MPSAAPGLVDTNQSWCVKNTVAPYKITHNNYYELVSYKLPSVKFSYAARPDNIRLLSTSA